MQHGSRLGLLALALAALATPARAHGPAPAVLEVLAVDDQGPTWLRATVGLLRRQPDGTWAHVCPAHWDGNDRMRAAVAGDRALVVSEAGHWSPVDRCEPWTELGAVRQAVADHETGRLYWLTEEGEGFVLHHPEGPVGAVPTATGSVQSLAASAGRVFVAGREGLAVWEGEWRVVSLPPRLRYLRAVTEEAAYAVVAHGTRLQTERIDLSDGSALLGPSADRLLGPVAFGGEMRVFADGEWLAERGASWVSHGTDERRWTYLGTVRGETYAASLDGLFRLDEADEPVAEPLFRFTQVVPSPCALCDPDWAHYGGEAGWLDTRAATSPADERQPIEGGCSAARRSPVWLPLVLLLIPLRRRPRSSGAR